MPKNSRLKTQSDDEVSSPSSSASSSGRSTPAPEQLIQNVYDKVCGSFKSDHSTSKPIERILNSCRRNRAQKFNKIRHEMFSVQGEVCYTNHSTLRYASNDVGILTSCLGEIPEFRTFYNQDLSLVSNNRSFTPKQADKLKNIFTFQHNPKNGQLVIYKKSSGCFDAYKHRGVINSNLKIAEELSKLFDQQSTAMLCLIRIKSKDEFVSLVKSILKNAKSESKEAYYEYFKAIEELCYITHIADAHIGRIPGIDKYFRSLLRKVAMGEATFEALFQPSNGTYFLGRSGGTHFREHINTLLSAKELRSNLAYIQELEKSIDENAIEEYMSDSSDDEGPRVTSAPAPRRDRDETDSIGSLPDKFEKHHIAKGKGRDNL